MSDSRKLFKYVVLFGVFINWLFGLWVTFFNPHSLLAALHLGAQTDVTWLYNYSILLMILSLFYIPAAFDPFRYRVNAWLLIIGRMVPVSTFLIGVFLGFMPPGFLGLALGDGTIGAIELFLLSRIFQAGPQAGDFGAPA